MAALVILAVGVSMGASALVDDHSTAGTVAWLAGATFMTLLGAWGFVRSVRNTRD